MTILAVVVGVVAGLVAGYKLYIPIQRRKRNEEHADAFRADLDRQWGMIWQGVMGSINFSNVIQQVSPQFCQICSEARAAEKGHLASICGIGYGKALEFLIKDYAKRENPGREREIESSKLSDCIRTYIGDELRKECAQLATWLRNDETHYVRKHPSKDVNDLKRLIDFTVKLIEEAERRKSYAASIGELRIEMTSPGRGVSGDSE